MTDKPHVLIHSSWYEPAMRKLDEIAITHHLYLSDDQNAFLEKHADQCSVIGTMHHCPSSLIERLPNLKLILNFGVGYDGVDIPTANRRGIKVVNTPSVLNDCVADMAMALTLAGRRHLVQADRYARKKRWPIEGDYPLVLNVHRSKIGILGLGRIGMEIAERCAAFKMEISYHQRTPRSDVAYTFYEKLIDMANDCDIIIAIIPGGNETRGIVN